MSKNIKERSLVFFICENLFGKMLVQLTYACKMNCSHCMSDCKPDGKLLQAKYARIHGYENYSFLKISYL